MLDHMLQPKLLLAGIPICQLQQDNQRSSGQSSYQVAGCAREAAPPCTSHNRLGETLVCGRRTSLLVTLAFN